MVGADIMPFAKLMGVEVLEAKPQRVVAELFVREDLCTTNSILHGGAVMAFADSVGAIATMLNLPSGAGTTTIESKTNFLAAVKAGETRARRVRPGSRRAHDYGLANAHSQARRQARRARHANANGSSTALVTVDQCSKRAVNRYRARKLWREFDADQRRHARF